MTKAPLSALILLIIMSAVSSLTYGCTGDKSEAKTSTDNFVTVRDGKFYIGDSVYNFVGTNLWYAPILASEGVGGDRQRLAKELDILQANGITNLRILAGADGPVGLKAHVSPVLQPEPGVYNDTLLVGLDYLLADLEKRGMKAVIYLTNAWEWSGGFSSYLQWAGKGDAVIPADSGYPAYMAYVKDFTLTDSAIRLLDNHIRTIVGRTNSITGRPYTESPAIMAWQIANEPRAFAPSSIPAFEDWIIRTANLIKEADPNHLVTTGSEGLWGCEGDLDLWTRIHSNPAIDYATIHIWPKNWGWMRDRTPSQALDNSIAETDHYIKLHIDSIAKYGRPLVIEEFGYPRDGDSYSIDTTTVYRDKYLAHILSYITDSVGVEGENVWAWGGTADPTHETWEPGDDYTGDPAQEPQGLYSVMASDTTTIAILKEAARAIKSKK